ncbi:hypothetical protein Tco_0837152 [Tanacetum coccineum]
MSSFFLGRMFLRVKGYRRHICLHLVVGEEIFNIPLLQGLENEKLSMWFGRCQCGAAVKDRLNQEIPTSSDGGKVDPVPKVDDVSLVDGVFDGAFGGDEEEDCYGRRCEGLEEEACVDAMEVEEK